MDGIVSLAPGSKLQRLPTMLRIEDFTDQEKEPFFPES